jgi:replicative DNA helicase
VKSIAVSILGGIMINDTNLENVIIGGLLIEPEKHILLNPDDFYCTDNRKIYETIKLLKDNKETADIATVNSKLMETKSDIPMGVLLEKLNSIQSTAALKSDYIPRLKKVTQKRNLIKMIETKREEVYSTDKDVSIICYEMLSDIKSIGIDACETEWDLQTSIQSILAKLEEDSKKQADDKLYYGLTRLDYVLAGLHKTELTILGARPGIGKSAFAFQTAMTLASRGNKILFFSLEMADRELLKRLLTSMSGISSARIRLPHTLKSEDFGKLVKASSELSNMALTINDKSMWLDDISKACIKAKEDGKLDVVIIDYLQLIRNKGEGDTRDQQLAFITRHLKLLAKELDVPILCLSQLNRKADDNSRPNLSNLRESGAIEQDADNVIFLHIPKDNDRKAEYMPIEVIIAKQRNGSIGYVEMFFHAKCYKFEEEIHESQREGTK